MHNHDFYALSADRKIDLFKQTFPGSLAQYTLIEEIAGGQFGRVYSATTNVHQEQPVIIKLMKHIDIEAFVALFFREKKEKKKHEKKKKKKKKSPECPEFGFVDILDAGYDDALRQAFIVYEKMDGDIIDFMQRRQSGVLEESVLSNFLQTMVRALYDLHYTFEMAHNDIKPDNILFREGRHGKLHFKIGDFGLVSMDAHTTLPGGIFGRRRLSAGTPRFFAPEIINREWCRKVSIEDMRAADVWAFGMTLFYFLTQGRAGLPFNLGEESYRRKLREHENVLERDYDCGLVEFFRRYGTVIERLPPTHRICYALISRMIVFNPRERITIRRIHRELNL